MGCGGREMGKKGERGRAGGWARFFPAPDTPCLHFQHARLRGCGRASALLSIWPSPATGRGRGLRAGALPRTRRMASRLLFFPRRPFLAPLLLSFPRKPTHINWPPYRGVPKLARDMLIGRGWAPEGQVTRRPAFSTTNRASAAGAAAASRQQRAAKAVARRVLAGAISVLVCVCVCVCERVQQSGSGFKAGCARAGRGGGAHSKRANDTAGFCWIFRNGAAPSPFVFSSLLTLSFNHGRLPTPRRLHLG